MSAHVSDEQLVAYWANELGEGEVAAIDEHVFGCDRCASASARLAAIADGVRGMLPPVIGRAELDVLRARGMRIRENDFQPGTRTEVVFERDVELLVHHLRGLQLADAERVDVFVRSEAHGQIHHEPFAPFDRERGEVLIACQRHFSSLPPDVVFDVHVHHAGATAPDVATYHMPHVFA